MAQTPTLVTIYLLGLLLTSFPVTSTLTIVDIKGPEVVLNGSLSRIVLDCVYDLNESEKEGLVVTWFFNRRPLPVYQWIPNNKPQELGILKGRVDLDYVATENEWTKHRALAIKYPTPDLTGEYTCRISTFKKEAFRRKNLIVYSPGKNFSMSFSKPRSDAVLVSCRAGELFPEPKISLRRSGPYSTRGLLDEAAKAQTLWMPERNSYNVSIEVEVSDYELKSETVFECVLSIPDTEYRVSQQLFYSPGHLTTTTTTTPVLITSFPASDETVDNSTLLTNNTITDSSDLSVSLKTVGRKSNPQAAESGITSLEVSVSSGDTDSPIASVPICVLSIFLYTIRDLSQQ